MFVFLLGYLLELTQHCHFKVLYGGIKGPTTHLRLFRSALREPNISVNDNNNGLNIMQVNSQKTPLCAEAGNSLRSYIGCRSSTTEVGV